MLSRIAAIAVCLVIVTACGTTFAPAPNVTPSPIATGQPTPTAVPTVTFGPVPTGPSAEIEVLVTGGDFDGSYRAVAADGCDSRPTKNTFRVSYANDFAADGFVALDLELRDAAQAEQDASGAFSLEISLGGPSAGVSYTLDPADDNGQGDAFLDVSPSDATLDLSVTAPDNTIIDLTVICDLV